MSPRAAGTTPPVRRLSGGFAKGGRMMRRAVKRMSVVAGLRPWKPAEVEQLREWMLRRQEADVQAIARRTRTRPVPRAPVTMDVVAALAAHLHRQRHPNAWQLLLKILMAHQGLLLDEEISSAITVGDVKVGSDGDTLTVAVKASQREVVFGPRRDALSVPRLYHLYFREMRMADCPPSTPLFPTIHTSGAWSRTEAASGSPDGFRVRLASALASAGHPVQAQTQPSLALGGLLDAFNSAAHPDAILTQAGASAVVAAREAFPWAKAASAVRAPPARRIERRGVHSHIALCGVHSHIALFCVALAAVAHGWLLPVAVADAADFGGGGRSAAPLSV